MTALPLPHPLPSAGDPLRIAIDVGPLYGHRTGVGVAAAGMVDALARRSTVHLQPYLVSSRSDPRPGHRRLPVPGVVASHLWSRFDRPRADRWLGDAHLVHGTNYVAPPSSRPTVVSVYDCWFLAHPDQANPLVRRAGHNLQRAVARGAWVHASSDATNRSARELLDTDRVVTVHLGPPSDTDRVPAQPPHDAGALAGSMFIVAIGTEEHRKNLPMLVRAFERCAAELEGVRLVVAGAAGDSSDDITATISHLPDHIADRIHRLGPVDDAVKRWLLEQAAVVAYPSLDEGFGFPILEAQASGVPIVASAVGAIPEVAGSGAALIESSDHEAFGDGLIRVLTAGVERLSLIQAGYRNIARFSWDDTAGQLERMYTDALADDR